MRQLGLDGIRLHAGDLSESAFDDSGRINRGIIVMYMHIDLTFAHKLAQRLNAATRIQVINARSGMLRSVMMACR